MALSIFYKISDFWFSLTEFIPRSLVRNIFDISGMPLTHTAISRYHLPPTGTQVKNIYINMMRWTKWPFFANGISKLSLTFLFKIHWSKFLTNNNSVCSAPSQYLYPRKPSSITSATMCWDIYKGCNFLKEILASVLTILQTRSVSNDKIHVWRIIKSSVCHN